MGQTNEEINLNQKIVYVSLRNNSLLTELFGEHDKHLREIEKRLDVLTYCRGNTVSITGESDNINKAKCIVESLYASLEKGRKVDLEDVSESIRKASVSNGFNKNFAELALIKTRKKNIAPFSTNQFEYINALSTRDVVFATGPAGTGKTYLAVAVAVSAFLNKQVDRIILSRPAVEAGEKLGFLPGDLKEKIDPYLRPLYDALHDMIPAENLAKFMESGEIEIAPLAFMRGRTLNNAFVIVDEAQNTTPTQMKMLLTRLGESSRIVITGDPSQMDLPIGTKSGLADAVERLQHIIEIGFITFKDEDIIRHPLTAKILRAYNN
jgi:phosphate starvation-inducible PhoH-like protein